jgi:hypothetical protein
MCWPPKQKNEMLNAERLRDLLAYDKSTGIMRWKSPTSNRVRINAVAGSSRADGFRKITIDGRSYLQHRLAVLAVTGRGPPTTYLSEI